MSALGGDGPLCIAVMWSMTAIVLIFLLCRVYTRVVCLAAYGMDDNFYVLSSVLLVAYSSVITVAALKGYGRNDLTPDQQVEATYFRMVGQTFSLLATGASKASVGFFLLRLVVARWQKISVATIMVVLGILSIVNSFFTWLACSPLPFAYDIRIEGTCFDTVPPAIMLAMGTVAVDVYFAVLPWIFIWKLNSPRREKFTIAGSLSLGLIAAVAGAIRIMNVKGVRDVPVAVIVWSQVETSLTLICVGIPVCRPLWSKYMAQWSQSSREKSYQRQGDTPGGGGGGDQQQQPIGLYTVGGTPMPGAVSSSSPGQTQDSSGKKKSKWGRLSSTFAGGSVVDRHERGADRDDGSEEVNLTTVVDDAANKSQGSLKEVASGESGEAPAAAAKGAKECWAVGAIATETTCKVQGDGSPVTETSNGETGGQPGIKMSTQFGFTRN